MASKMKDEVGRQKDLKLISCVRIQTELKFPGLNFSGITNCLLENLFPQLSKLNSHTEKLLKKC